MYGARPHLGHGLRDLPGTAYGHHNTSRSYRGCDGGARDDARTAFGRVTTGLVQPAHSIAATAAVVLRHSRDRVAEGLCAGVAGGVFGGLHGCRHRCLASACAFALACCGAQGVLAELLHYGMAHWLTAVFSQQQSCLRNVGLKDLGPAALGQFTMAMMLAQVPLTPISYAAPLLFRRWIDRPGAAASRQIASMVFALFLMAAAIAWLVALVKPELGLGAAYVGALPALVVLLTGCAAEAALAC